jgi:hypothetical protein
MHFNWGLLFFMAFNNPIFKSIHISSDPRIWFLSDPYLYGVWLLFMAKTKTLSLLIYTFLIFKIVNINRSQDQQTKKTNGYINFSTTYLH